jgi:hypothetical protein
MLNNIEMSEIFPVEIQYPIKNMPKNKAWTWKIQPGMFIKNVPPMRKIFINYSLVSEYNIGNAEREREAILYLYLNGACGGHIQRLAKIWGLHRNTIGNYIKAYHNLGIKGLSDLYYQPEEKQVKIEEPITAMDQISFFEEQKDTSITKTEEVKKKTMNQKKKHVEKK